MKNTTKTITIAIIILIASFTAQAKQKIGTYDSRAVAIWYSNTEEFRKEMGAIFDGAKKAKEKNDTAELKKFEQKGQLTQRILHDKGFGRGSVAEILEKYKDKISEYSKKENFTALVSKWELLFSNSEAEVIDITVPLLKALGSDEKVIKMYDEMKRQDPIKDAFFIEN